MIKSVQFRRIFETACPERPRHAPNHPEAPEQSVKWSDLMLPGLVAVTYQWLSVDSVEKVDFGFHGWKVRV